MDRLPLDGASPLVLVAAAILAVIVLRFAIRLAVRLALVAIIVLVALWLWQPGMLDGLLGRLR